MTSTVSEDGKRAPSGKPDWRAFWGRSLGTKLLFFTIGAIMLVETLILVQSATLEQQRYLSRDVEKAHLVLLTLANASNDPAQLPINGNAALQHQLLDSLDAQRVWGSFPGLMTIVLEQPSIDPMRSANTARMLEPNQGSWLGQVMDAAGTVFTRNPDQDIAISATAPNAADVPIVILKTGTGLVQHMRGYVRNILALSFIIALATGILLYAALYVIIVRPMQILARQMEDFAAAPQSFRQSLATGRRDEIGVVQVSFDSMRDTLQAAFRQKTRLASLGTAVAKINHDLKNILSTALLLSDSLEESSDPMVARIAPRLVGSLEKAVGVCGDSLRFTHDGIGRLQAEPLSLTRLADDLRHALGEQGSASLEINFSNCDAVVSDRISLYRLLSNLVLNASQAGATRIQLLSDREGTSLMLQVRDNGPGLPPRVQDNLFQPFISVGKQGGSGLGLSISRELAEALGGSLSLLETNTRGTCFLVALPLG